MSHIHKYRKFTTANGKTFWRCVLMACNHVLYQDELLPGRDSICWRCGRAFTLLPSHLEQTRPTCGDCREKRSHIANRFKGSEHVND